MEFNLRGLWVVAAVMFTAFTTVPLVVLKLCGVLLLSWPWVFSPLPIGIVLVILIAGVASLLG